MNIEIICIGNLKEPWLREAEREYVKRLAPYCKLSITELGEKRLPKNASVADEEKVRKSEGEALLLCTEKYISAYVYTMDMRGKQLTSEEFSEQIAGHALTGRTPLIFLVGGSLGLPEAARKRADRVLSFSEMTFPHQLARIILLEQLYRSQKILRGEPYHK
jgi:23S rRNA (pseudouridine1915-N3)-methyltransferase